MNSKIKFLLFFVTYLTLESLGLASINIIEKGGAQNISSFTEFAFIDKEIAVKNISGINFIKNKSDSLALGYSNQKSLIHFSIKNNLNVPLKSTIYLNSINGKMDLYTVDPLKNVHFLSSSGTDIPIIKRPLPGIYGAFKIEMESDSTKEYLIILESRHNINASLILSSEELLKQSENEKISFLDFYTGGIVLLVIYNLFIFLMLKDYNYVFYCLYATTFATLSLVISGKFDQILHFQNTTLSHHLIIFSASCLISAALFTMKFLDIKTHLKKLYNFYLFIITVGFFLIIIALTPLIEKYSKEFGIIIDLSIFSSLLVYIYSAIKLYKKSNVAKFYLLSWGFVLVAVTMWFGMNFNIIPFNSFTLNALPISNMFEMLTLSLALAYRIESLNKEKIEAIKEAKDKIKYQRLVRVLSHDVANSLTIVNAYAKKLARSTTLVENDRYQAEKIYNAGENIKNILGIVREQQRAVDHNHSLNLVATNILECIHFSKTLHEDALQSKNIRLEISIPNDLTIKVDRTSFINNIINNLLSNAIKFSFENSIIEIYSTISHDLTIIIFKDHGIGISSEKINDIFFSDKIISSHGTNFEEGNGLGTGLVREYVTLFSGKIQVTSTPKEKNNTNHGTIIKIIFPK
jgi:signal transduction histidine kinase